MQCALHPLIACARVQGVALWGGVKRLALEIPIADQSPAAQVKLVSQLLAAIPQAAGLPTIVFGSQEVADHARNNDAPFAAFSVAEAATPPEGDDDQLSGPLLLFETSYDDAAACEKIVNSMWAGRVVVVVNAGWLRDAPPATVEGFAESLDAIYYFLPVTFSVRCCCTPLLVLSHA
jgi:hypothetical protein